MLIGFALRQMQFNKKKLFGFIFTVALSSTILTVFMSFSQSTIDSYADLVVHSRVGHGMISHKGLLESNRQGGWDFLFDPKELEWSSLSHDVGVKHLFPRLQAHGRAELPSRVATPLTLTGLECDRERNHFRSFQLLEGTCPNADQDEVVISQSLADTFGLKVGNTIAIQTSTIHGTQNTMDSKVSGIYIPAEASYQGHGALVALDSLQRLLDTEKVETAFILLSKGEWQDFQRQWEPKHLELAATEFSRIESLHFQDAVDWMRSQDLVVTLLLFLVLTASVATSILLIHLERAPTYGSFLANGDSRWALSRFVLAETSVFVALGCALGTLASWLACTYLKTVGVTLPPPPGMNWNLVVRTELGAAFASKSFLVAMAASELAALWCCHKLFRQEISSLLRS